MFDGMGVYKNNGNINLTYWKNMIDYKVISFSKNVYNILKKLGFKTIYIKYSLSPYLLKNNKNFNETKSKFKIFFWQRRNEITWNTIKKLLNPLQIEAIHIHTAVDPNMSFVRPTEEEMAQFNITFSDWFETKNDYLQKVNEYDIFIAPRPYEGIGMSFIEAMAMGKCVIAPNFPTMNEYIKHGYNGLLYDINNPKMLDLSNASKLGEKAYETIKKIYSEWKKDEHKIIDFILNNKVKDNKMSKQETNELINSIEELCKISFFKNPIKKVKAYKNMIKTYHSVKNKIMIFENDSKKKVRQKKLLIVFPHNPFLLQNGVQSRFYSLLKYFKQRDIEVDILSHINFVDNWGDKHLNHKLVRQVYLNDFKASKIEQSINKFNSILPNFAFNSLKKQFKQLLENNKYDYILISYVHWAEILKDIDNSQIETILTIEDFISINNYERHNGNYNLGQSINEEIERINLFDKAICISKDEMSFFERVCKNVEFHYIPHFLEKNFHEYKVKECDILFVGSDNPFNKEGMIWFFEKVMPYLNKKFKIKIIGRVNEHLDKYKKQYSNVKFVNYVENLDDEYKKTKITICPLQAGTGLKIKVVESLSFGLPIVTTKYGVIGMDTRCNGCIVADEPKEFADSIELLLTNKEVYIKYQKEAQNFFMENFFKESVYKKLDKIFFNE
jgi:glycosyltransferase involved in cell wall biosynthesis